MRVGQKDENKNQDLEAQVEELTKFCKKLIEALQAVEKKQKNIYYLPEGTYFGITIE